MTERLICAGFGGQGVLLLGQLLAYSCMHDGKNVTWMPAYGTEMRGGTANCGVIISEDEIGCPVVSCMDTLIAMNLPSLERFQNRVTDQGHIVFNSSLIRESEIPELKDISVIGIPANDIAISLGDHKVANMVMLGAYLFVKGIVPSETVNRSMQSMFGQSKAHMIDLNIRAIERGFETASKIGYKIN